MASHITELLESLTQASKLADISKETMDYAKTVDREIAQVWLAQAVTDICETQKIDIDYFVGYLKSDFQDLYKKARKEVFDYMKGKS